MAEQTGNKKKTAREFNVDPAQIRRWLKNKEKIRKCAKNSSYFNTTRWSESGRQRTRRKYIFLDNGAAQMRKAGFYYRYY